MFVAPSSRSSPATDAVDVRRLRAYDHALRPTERPIEKFLNLAKDFHESGAIVPRRSAALMWAARSYR